jgi:hypothetical protein
MSKLVKIVAAAVLLAGAAIATAPSPAEAQRWHGGGGWHGGGWHGGGWRGGGWRGGGWRGGGWGYRRGGWGWGGWGPGFAVGLGLGTAAAYGAYPYYGGYYGGPYYGGYGPYYAGYYGGGGCGWRTVRVWRYGYMTYRRVWRCW